MSFRSYGLAAADVRHQAAQRLQEAARNELVNTLATDQLLSAKFKNDERIDNSRRIREFSYHDSEKKKLMMLKEEQEALKRKNEFEEQQRIEKANFDKKRTVEIREEKMRQKVCAASVELRDLQQKLDCAYMNVGRAKQIEEAKLKREHVKQDELVYARVLADIAKNNEKSDIQKAKDLADKCKFYSNELKGQLDYKENQKKLDEETFAREKAIVDATVAKIVAEDVSARESESAKREKIRSYIVEHAAHLEATRQADRERMKLEEKAIAEHVAVITRRADEIHKQRRELEKRRTELQTRLSREKQIIEAARGESEVLRLELAQEEEIERQEQRERDANEKRIRMRLELISALAEQIYHRRLMREAEAESEASYRQRMQTQMETEAKFEQLGREQRRLRQIEHRKEIDMLVAQRKAKTLAERKADEEDQNKERILEEYRQALIENERQRLLRMHATKLVGYLPKGVLKEERDLDLFDDDFRRKFETGRKI